MQTQRSQTPSTFVHNSLSWNHPLRRIPFLLATTTAKITTIQTRPLQNDHIPTHFLETRSFVVPSRVSSKCGDLDQTLFYLEILRLTYSTFEMLRTETLKVLYLASDAELEILNTDCSGLSAFEVPYIFQNFKKYVFRI